MFETAICHWKKLRLPVALILGTFFIRFLWLGDMEFKKDEQETVRTILNLGTQSFSPLGPIATHSGFAHSSGFFHFMRWFSFGSKNPLVLAGAIAGINALVISVFLILFRNFRQLFLCFALCATSMVLALHARKIWTPNMVAPWLLLGLGLFLLNRQFQRPYLNVAAAFAMLMAGHMYPSGGFIAAVVTICILFSAWIQRDRKTFLTWLTGSALGGLTYLPYLFLLLTHAPGSHGVGFAPQNFEWGQLKSAYAHIAVLPSSFPAYAIYLRPIKQWMIESLSGPTAMAGSRPALVLTLLWISASTLIGATLFWVTLGRLFFSWKAMGKRLLNDPIAFSALVLLCVMPWALFLTRMGSHLHYWIGVIPFIYYLISWVSSFEPEKTISKILTRLAWSLCVTSFLASFHFLVLVHHHHGLPGEYGPSYSVQGERR